MINLDEVYKYKKSFGFFSNQLTFPRKIDFHPREFDGTFDSSHPAFPYIEQYWKDMNDISLDDIQQVYTQTFDFDRDTNLYMTYFKFEDQKERGQMLAKLKVLYEMFGLKMPDNELSDYLPLMLEFLYAAEWRGDDRAAESLTLLIMVLEDGTYHMIQALERNKSPYFNLIKGLRETFKACVDESMKEGEQNA
ncbi:nitrate reductase molybdenum cofactor assembly chaperone [Salinicoccus sp. YB14-2]|uniref:nitrate reductase molybdenum cofactor assembly chaperone n=1 Tax=Salinicoccus sp. YB14-2 TaxID=1572701 RepID=UPI00068A8EEA|nr:nitrate reductase molybdenum cofactor assembly chaperone [Salinicoccus sp. YB14-2]